MKIIAFEEHYMLPAIAEANPNSPRKIFEAVATTEAIRWLATAAPTATRVIKSMMNTGHRAGLFKAIGPTGPHGAVGGGPGGYPGGPGADGCPG